MCQTLTSGSIKISSAFRLQARPEPRPRPRRLRTMRRRSTRLSAATGVRWRPPRWPSGSGVSPGTVTTMVKRLAELGPRRARALPRRSPHRGGRAGRARGDPPPPSARNLSVGSARDALGSRPRRGRSARALHLRGPGADDRREARRSTCAIRTATRSPAPISPSSPTRAVTLAELEPGDHAAVRARLRPRLRDAALSRRARDSPGLRARRHRPRSVRRPALRRGRRRRPRPRRSACGRDAGRAVEAEA